MATPSMMNETLNDRKLKAAKKEKWYKQQLSKPSAFRGVLEEYIKLAVTKQSTDFNGRIEYLESNFEIRSYKDEVVSPSGKKKSHQSTYRYTLTENEDRVLTSKSKDECVKRLDEIVRQRVLHDGWVVIGTPSKHFTII